MNLLVTIIRILVGLLFIFSGLVKANDPLGLSYKMQEFFELWHLSRFDNWTLWLSVLMNGFEIIAGFALLIGWQKRIILWLLLALIVFFTFLTGYTYITGKPTNCGCFGDCLLISSKTSFLKDVALALMIAFLLWQQQRIRPFFTNRINNLLMAIVTFFSFGFQWYTLTYLPIVDCLPYKTGNNIQDKMKMPPNAIPDSTVITFVYEKDGKEVEFTADKFPDDFNTPPYVFKSRYDKVIRKGSNNEPPIKGFTLSGITGIDSTSIILAHPQTLLLFIENFSNPVSAWEEKFSEIYKEANAKNIPVYVVTGNLELAYRNFAGTAFAAVPVLRCDFTAIRTAARSNPTLYLIESGTVRGKWSDERMEQVKPLLKAQEIQRSQPTADSLQLNQ
jgi:uncharacterized membrane protein YphA (DoxX/SURF4 family)